MLSRRCLVGLSGESERQPTGCNVSAGRPRGLGSKQGPRNSQSCLLAQAQPSFMGRGFPGRVPGTGYL